MRRRLDVRHCRSGPARSSSCSAGRGRAGGLIERLTLDPASQALASPCFTSHDVGVVRLRVALGGAGHAQRDGHVARPCLRGLQGPVDARDRPRDRVATGLGRRRRGRHVPVRPGGVHAPDPGVEREAPALDDPLRHLRVRLPDHGPASPRPGATSGAVRNLWILGQGDPGVTAATIGALARKVADAGIERVRGRVFGSTGYFRRDWDAPGWNDVARDYVNRPTALVFDRNAGADPEREAAKTLTTQARGARRAASAASPGAGDRRAGSRRSRPSARGRCSSLLTKMLRPSDNFIAETLGKRLGRRDARRARDDREGRRPRSRPGRTLTGRGSRSTTTPASRTRTA